MDTDDKTYWDGIAELVALAEGYLECDKDNSAFRDSLAKVIPSEPLFSMIFFNRLGEHIGSWGITRPEHQITAAAQGLRIQSALPAYPDVEKIVIERLR